MGAEGRDQLGGARPFYCREGHWLFVFSPAVGRCPSNRLDYGMADERLREIGLASRLQNAGNFPVGLIQVEVVQNAIAKNVIEGCR